MQLPSRILLVFSCLVALVLPASAQPEAQTPVPPPEAAISPDGTAHTHLRAGDEAFAASDFALAELEYRRAAERQPSYRASYNLGVALARQGREDEAAAAFSRAKRFAQADDAQQLNDAAYNAGTAAAATEDLKASIADYIDALRANPQDLEAKQNLTQILRRLRQQQKEQQEQQQQQQEGEEGESGEQPPQDQEQQQSDEEATENEESEPQNPEPSEQPEEPTEQPSESDEPTEENGEPSKGDGTPSEPVDVAREEAERLLEIARELERETQEKVKLGERSPTRPAKDW